jgi:hypothetical protein
MLLGIVTADGYPVTWVDSVYMRWYRAEDLYRLVRLAAIVNGSRIVTLTCGILGRVDVMTFWTINVLWVVFATTSEVMERGTLWLWLVASLVSELFTYVFWLHVSIIPERRTLVRVCVSLSRQK